MESFLNQPDDMMCEDCLVTPELLAWKLVMDDDVNDYAGVLQPCVFGDNQKNMENIRYESLEDQFQILITIFMEMIFDILKINHINSFIDDDGVYDDSIDLESTFSPNENDILDDSIILLIRDKFKKVRIFLGVMRIYDSKIDDSRNYGSSSNYYCRIMLKDTIDGSIHFKNNNNIDPAKRYTFLMQNNKELRKHKKLDDFYAVCNVNDKKYKISFCHYNIHYNHSS